MKTTFIYALKESGKIRYVGKSNNPKSRFSFHRHQSKSHRSHLGSWLLSLSAKGVSPEIEILDEVPFSQWEFWEREYIRVFRALGMALVNTTDGGEGAPSGKGNPMFKRNGAAHHFYGKTHSLAAREKIRAAHLGVKASPATRELMRAAQAARRLREKNP